MKVKLTEEQYKQFEAVIKTTGLLMSNKGVHFKIGKTNLNLKDRFDSEYKSAYRNIYPIWEEDDSDFISKLEQILILYFKRYYTDLCDNQNEGEEETTEERFNCVYIVIS